MSIPSLFETDLELLLAPQLIINGGKWYPKSCVPNHHVAILIPYRNREDHLKKFLYHMHPFLARQKLSYGIYVIEPVSGLTFNRGLLLNVGFVESNKETGGRWQCHVLHDVDLLPEDDHTSYSCPEYPTHLSHLINAYNYK